MPGRPKRVDRTTTEALGKRIFAARLRLGLTQAQLAQKIGTYSSSVQQWERGTSFPHPRHWPALAQALGLSVEYLLWGKEEESDL